MALAQWNTDWSRIQLGQVKYRAQYKGIQMRRNTISEGVAAPLPGNRLSALPTNTQLDTAQEHPTNNPLEH